MVGGAYAWPTRRDGGDGHKHQLTADESRTLCGRVAGAGWIRGDLETPGDRCPRCDAAAVNSAADPCDREAPGAMLVGVRSQIRKAMARADWALTAYWAATTDDGLAIAAARVRETAAEVDRLYSEFGAAFLPVVGAA